MSDYKRSINIPVIQGTTSLSDEPVAVNPNKEGELTAENLATIPVKPKKPRKSSEPNITITVTKIPLEPALPQSENPDTLVAGALAKESSKKINQPNPIMMDNTQQQMDPLTSFLLNMAFIVLFYYVATKIFSFYGIGSEVYGIYFTFYLFLYLTTMILPTEYPKIKK